MEVTKLSFIGVDEFVYKRKDNCLEMKSGKTLEFEKTWNFNIILCSRK